MSIRIKNGGIELGFLELVELDRDLTEAEKQRKKQLEELPKKKWVYLDENANPTQLIFDERVGS